MTTPLDSHEYDTVGAFTPHSANEGEHGAADWIAEVLPTDESAIDRTVHRDDHLPRGWHDFGAMGWAGVLLMVVVVGLMVWGYLLPWLGATRMWAVDALR